MITKADWIFDDGWSLIVRWTDWAPVSDEQEAKFVELDKQGFISHRQFPKKVDRAVHIRCKL